eukprot:1162074-Pelagomonas_calceolata.AAC.12
MLPAAQLRIQPFICVLLATKINMLSAFGSRHVFHIQTHGMHACSSPATVFLTIRLRVYNLGGKLIAVEQMAAEMEIEIPDTEVCPPSSGNACMH